MMTNAKIVKWFDSKSVHFAYSIAGVEPECTCTRWSNTDNKYVSIKKLAFAFTYNRNMGGVDLLGKVNSNNAMKAKCSAFMELF